MWHCLSECQFGGRTLGFPNKQIMYARALSLDFISELVEKKVLLRQKCSSKKKDQKIWDSLLVAIWTCLSQIREVLMTSSSSSILWFPFQHFFFIYCSRAILFCFFTYGSTSSNIVHLYSSYTYLKWIRSVFFFHTNMEKGLLEKLFRSYSFVCFSPTLFPFTNVPAPT